MSNPILTYTLCYILFNEKARKATIKTLKELSVVIDKKVKDSELGKIISPQEVEQSSLSTSLTKKGDKNVHVQRDT